MPSNHDALAQAFHDGWNQSRAEAGYRTQPNPGGAAREACAKAVASAKLPTQREPATQPPKGALAAKLRRLLVYSEAGAAAFYDRHGGCSTDATANAIDHLRTALTGLSRPRLAA